MSLVVRKVTMADRQGLYTVEQGSTPGFSYLPSVFDRFVQDEHGEFLAAELDGRLVACGKFTVLPDGSAWLETLRVVPDVQRSGIGKRFYERFYEIARAKGITTMRMYTDIGNHASKGLAERFGFSVAGTFQGGRIACSGRPGQQARFRPVSDRSHAVERIMSFHGPLAGFMVMNRTFYAITPRLAEHLAQQGMLYEDPGSGSTIVIGARFAPRTALHIGLMDGDLPACLAFAQERGAEENSAKLCCLFPPAAVKLHAALADAGFEPESSNFIVMEAQVDASREP